MPRSKNRVLAIREDGKWIDVQWQRENGEVVKGTFELQIWLWAPRVEREKVLKAGPPVTVYRQGGRERGRGLLVPAETPSDP